MKFLVALGVVALVAGSAVYAGNRHDERLWRDHERVRPGMSAKEAKAILGEPSWLSKCGARFAYGHSPACNLELGYRSAFAPLNPLYWVVQLDGQGRVISSDWIGSP